MSACSSGRTATASPTSTSTVPKRCGSEDCCCPIPTPASAADPSRARKGALLSATSRKSKVKEATGGLLRKLGGNGLLVIKDVTSILSTDRNTRGPVLSAIREIYDGRYRREVGTDGGQILTLGGPRCRRRRVYHRLGQRSFPSSQSWGTVS